MKLTLPLFVLGLLVLASIGSPVFVAWQLTSVALSDDKEGVLPGLILLVIEVGLLVLSVKAFGAGRKEKPWVRVYLWVVTVLVALIFVLNIRAMRENNEWFKFVVSPLAILFLTAAAWLLLQACTAVGAVLTRGILCRPSRW
mgnify:CR=1 FL=1